MKRILLFLGVLIILINSVSALDCVVPTDGMIITEDTIFCEGEYYLPNGITIGANNINLDCNNAKLVGEMNDTWIPIIYLSDYSAISLRYKNNVKINNCDVTNYVVGIHLYHSSNNIIENNIGRNNRDSIYLDYYSDNNVIMGNYLKHNLWRAIMVQASGYNLIENNEVVNNKHHSYIYYHNKGQGQGIELAGIKYPLNIGGNNIVRNNFFSNNYWAIFIWGKGNNTIIGNTFKNNELGVFFFRHPQYEDTSDNKVYDNHFTKSGIDGWFNYETTNYFCIDGIGNTYEHKANGPIC